MIKREAIEKTIGKGFSDKLEEIILSSFHFSRREMVEHLGCANFIAAAKLDKVFKKLKIETPKELWHRDPMDLARIKGVGEASLFVAMCILEAGGYDPVKWWGWNNNVVKFSTFKHHAIKRAKRRGQEVA